MTSLVFVLTSADAYLTRGVASDRTTGNVSGTPIYSKGISFASDQLETTKPGTQGSHLMRHGARLLLLSLTSLVS